MHPPRVALAIVLVSFASTFTNISSLWAVTPVACSSPASAQPPATEYFVSLSDNVHHLAHVSVRFPQSSGTITLKMPVWNALYQVRNFAANVENVRAIEASGRPVPVVNSKPSEWEVSSLGHCIVVDYDIRLDNGGPFGSQLSAGHGFFNWAMVLMYSPDTRSGPMSVRFLDVPPTWGLNDAHIMGETSAGKVEQAVGVAHGYEELADSPAEVGIFQRSEFQQDGATYHIVVHADPKDYDTGNLHDILRKITHAAVDWMADRPYDQYTFLYHFPRGPAAGGMEHAYGTAIDVSADRLHSSMMAVASVSAHEFFHLWNVKRIRPQSLEPIDYQRAMDTRALWFSEGVTSTVSDMLLARAGLLNDRQYIDRIASEINELQSRPAHHWQSAEESSLNAWFEGNAFYQTPERSISYYNKGEVLGILLDLRIRQITQDRKSLRDLFQWMNENYAKKGRFFPDSDGVQQAAETICGVSFSDFFHDYVAGVKELPYNNFFAFVGLQIAETTVRTATPGFTTTTNPSGRPEIVSVDANSEAQRAGVAVGDSVIEMNGRTATAAMGNQLARMKAGSTVKLRLENRRGQISVKLRLTSREEQVYLLQEVPGVTPEQRAHRVAWIHGDDENGSGQ
jgi:predicted metalloprotease with PDZ domain